MVWSHQSPLESVVLDGGAIGVDDQLAGLIVKGELAEVLENEEEEEKEEQDNGKGERH